jgi:hypothetical protein
MHMSITANWKVNEMKIADQCNRIDIIMTNNACIILISLKVRKCSVNDKLDWMALMTSAR